MGCDKLGKVRLGKVMVGWKRYIVKVSMGCFKLGPRGKIR
jgi:hypothetical protein